MFSFFKKKSPPETPQVTPVAVKPSVATPPQRQPLQQRLRRPPSHLPAERKSWLDKLKTGLRKTGSSIATVFTGTQIDDALYEELESALLMADTGVKATQHLLDDLKRRVKEKPRRPTPPM